jgi:hypothetical protein
MYNNSGGCCRTSRLARQKVGLTNYLLKAALSPICELNLVAPEGLGRVQQSPLRLLEPASL